MTIKPGNDGQLMLELTTPPGRLVQGDCSTPSEKDMHGQPLVYKSGPNIGQPRKEYFVGVAFQKGVAEVEAMRAEFEAFLRQCWPHLFNPQTGQCILPQGISDKWIDGDAYDTNGKAWNTREGFAGHWVLRASSGFAPQLYAAGDHRNQLPPGAIQRGSFVRVAITATSNMNNNKAGIYVNLSMVELAGIGPAIRSGPDAAQVFGAATGALPPGATVVTPGALPAPQAPGVPPAPGVPVAAPPVAPPAAPVAAPHNPLAAAQADGWAVHPTSPTHFYRGQEVLDGAALSARYPAPVAAAPPPVAPPVAPVAPPAALGVPAAPGAPVQPYHGYAQPPGAPIAPPVAPSAPQLSPAAPAPFVPVGPVMTAKAGGVPYETFKAQGWQDAQMIQEGYMLPGNVQ
jgi:hypothetical protein